MEMWEVILIVFVSGIEAHSVIEGRPSVTGTHSPSNAVYIKAADQFLTSYGYYRSSDHPPAQLRNPSLENHSDIERTNALKLFQKFYNLPQSGKLDKETTQLMQSPRCGNPDFTSNLNTLEKPTGLEEEEITDVSQNIKETKNQGREKSGINMDTRRRRFDTSRKTRVKRAAYVLRDKGGDVYKWKRNNMTWGIMKYSEKISPTFQRGLIKIAQSRWERVVPIKFVEQRSRLTEMKIWFHSFATISMDDNVWHSGMRWVNKTGSRKKLSHGRQKRNTSPNRTDTYLAHAMLPFYASGSPSRDIHFDVDHDWKYMELVSVAIHEIGHSLGLAHSSDKNSVMYPYNRHVYKFSKSDLESVEAIYGPEDESSEIPCKSMLKAVDTIIKAAQKSQYLVFSGDKFQRLAPNTRTTQRFALKSIGDAFERVTLGNDLVFSAKNRHFNSIFFVAGNRMHQYDLTTFEMQSVIKIPPELFPETPILALKSPPANRFTDETDTLLFGKTYYWRFTFDGNRVSYGGRKKRELLEKFLDLARLKFEVQWTNGEYYYVNHDDSYYIGIPHRDENSALKGSPYWMELMICDHPTESVTSGSDSSKRRRMSSPSLVLVIMLSLIKLY